MSTCDTIPRDSTSTYVHLRPQLQEPTTSFDHTGNNLRHPKSTSNKLWPCQRQMKTTEIFHWRRKCRRLTSDDAGCCQWNSPRSWPSDNQRHLVSSWRQATSGEDRQHQATSSPLLPRGFEHFKMQLRQEISYDTWGDRSRQYRRHPVSRRHWKKSPVGLALKQFKLLHRHKKCKLESKG